LGKEGLRPFSIRVSRGGEGEGEFSAGKVPGENGRKVGEVSLLPEGGKETSIALWKWAKRETTGSSK